MSADDLCTSKLIGGWKKVERLVYEIVIEFKNGIVNKPVDKVSNRIGIWASRYINIGEVK